MVEFTQDVIEFVKIRFAAFDMNMDDVREKLENIYDQPYMGQFTDDTERQMAAVKILMAQTMAKTEKASFSKSETIVMRIEGKEEVSSFKKKDGEEGYRSGLYVTAIIDGESKFGQVTLWGDANEMHPKLTIGKTYAIPSVIGSRDPLTISVNDPVDVEIVDDEISPLIEIIKTDYSPIGISEMEYQISRDQNDQKVVKGTVLSSWMKVTRNDNNMGFLKLVGDDENEITVVKFGRSADQVVMFGTGSMVYVVGQITDAVMNADGTEQYSVGMWGSLIVPMLIIPPEMADTPGIETSETSIQKSDGSEQGFVEKAAEGW